MVVSTQDHIRYNITGRWGRQVRINTWLDYDFEQIRVDLNTSCPRMSWVCYELTCSQKKSTNITIFTQLDLFLGLAPREGHHRHCGGWLIMPCRYSPHEKHACWCIQLGKGACWLSLAGQAASSVVPEKLIWHVKEKMVKLVCENECTCPPIHEILLGFFNTPYLVPNNVYIMISILF